MRFTSKRNEVVLKAGVIVKYHQDQAALEREAEMLSVLHKARLAVPVLLALEVGSLHLEYIQGVTYESLVEDMTFPQALSLAQWLRRYHQITGFLRGDVNLRNFLWASERCVGLDFEDSPTLGAPEIDQGKIIAFTATYNPAFSLGKIRTANLLLKAFTQVGGEPWLIRHEYFQEIAAMNRRRNNLVDKTLAMHFFSELGKIE